MVAAACLFDWAALSDADRDRLMWLNDSKQVKSPRRRALLRQAILELAVSVSEVVISVDEIDGGGGVHEANYRALRQAVSGLEPAPDKCFIDWYHVPDCRYPTTRLIDGDSKSAAVAAASIIARRLETS
jgi:ribonuclease HII